MHHLLFKQVAIITQSDSLDYTTVYTINAKLLARSNKRNQCRVSGQIRKRRVIFSRTALPLMCLNKREINIWSIMRYGYLQST